MRPGSNLPSAESQCPPLTLGRFQPGEQIRTKADFADPGRGPIPTLTGSWSELWVEMAVWPFETGWATKAKWLPNNVSILHAEIYPSVREPKADLIKDRGQVRGLDQKPLGCLERLARPTLWKVQVRCLSRGGPKRSSRFRTQRQERVDLVCDVKTIAAIGGLPMRDGTFIVFDCVALN